MGKLFRITQFCVLLLWTCVCHGQTLRGLPVVQNYHPHEYQSHRQNWDAAQAPDGTMYFANGKGILSFNGEEWELTLMPNRGHVRSLAIDDDGTVYAGGNNDIGKLAYDENGQRYFESFLPLVDSTDHSMGRVRQTLITEEGIFFQSFFRLFQVKDGQVKVWKFDGSLYRIFNINKKLYAVDLNRGLLVWNGEDFKPCKNGHLLKNKKARVLLPIDQKLFVGTYNEGAFLFDFENLTPFDIQGSKSLKDLDIYDGLITSDEHIALCSYSQQGVYIFDKEGQLYQTLGKQTGLYSGNILTIFEDAQSSLWVGLQEGIARVDINAPYSLYDRRMGLDKTIQKIIIEDNEIIGGTGEGMIKIASKDDGYEIREFGNINSTIWDFRKWNDQIIVGSSAGLFSFKGDQKTTIKSTFMAPKIFFPKRDQQGMIACRDDGFNYFKWDGNQWKSQGEISGIRGSVRGIIESAADTYWLETRSNGIFRIELNTIDGKLSFDNPIITHYNQYKGVPPSELDLFRIDDLILVRNELDSLYEYNKEKDVFISSVSLSQKFNLTDGKLLPKKEISDKLIWLDYIQENQKQLVKASKKIDGNYKLEFFPFTYKMSNFRDPFGNDIFYSQGEQVWFSASFGIMQVELDKLHSASPTVPIQLSRIDNNEQTIIAKKGKELSLDFNQNDLNFSFSSPFFQDGDNLQYSTQLVGFDEQWSNWTKTPNKSFTNLPEGEYTFQVKAQNDNYIESEPANFEFTIKPPWHRSNLAYLSYLLLGGFLIWLLGYWRSARLRQNQLVLEAMVKERTEEIEKQAQEINELYQVKNKFLANISHELRTPLTLILGPAEQLLNSSKKGKEKQQLTWIHKNGQRLLRLINQLLDLSKLEAGKLQLQAAKQDLIPFCKYIVSSFESLANQKEVELQFESDIEELALYFDAEKLEQVLNNLLFNAFKFTPKGSIILSLKKVVKENADSFAVLSIKDTGNGISKEKIPHIFDRFFQAHHKDEEGLSGSGIGLSLSKELVELHQGQIEVESVLGTGTTFSIFLPFGKSHLAANQITDVPNNYFIEPTPTNDKTKIVPIPITDEANAHLPLILLVDDNPDILDYIQMQLNGQFRYLRATNGKQGLEIAKSTIPDLIISDVMMPEMNGFEFCESIKEDMTTDHIPVILLTARIGEESKLKGLETRADAYLQKPFNSKELQLRIQNLIENRKRLRKRFTEKIVFQPATIAETPLEETFLQGLIDAIEENLTDVNFDVSQLAKIMAMSKSQLNRKMKAVLNKSPNQFIRSYRLAKAQELIKNTNHSLSEIAYDTGFSSPAYFSKCFSDEFGYPPSSLVD